jgi:HEAT repeat protein
LSNALVTTKGSLRTEIAHACLQSAEKLLAEQKNDLAAAIFRKLSRPGETAPVRMAALRGTIRANPDKAVSLLCQALTSGDPVLEKMAIQLVPDVREVTATEQIAQCLGKVSLPVRSLLLGALALRGDAAARAVVEAAASSKDRAIRLAALNALGICGDETSVNTLMDRILAGAGTEESEVARKSLVRLQGHRVNRVLTSLISKDNTRAKTEAIRILAARNGLDAIPNLKKAAQDQNSEIRKESWKALGSLAREKDVAGLLDLLVGAGQGEREEAEKAVTAVLKKPDRTDVRPLLQKLDAVQEPQVRGTLLRIASMVGDDRALPVLRRALQAREPSVRDVAIRGLAAWPTPAPFEDLVQLAGHAQESVHRILALRAAIRLSTRVEGTSPNHRTRLFTQLMQLAREPAEQKAVLAELGRCSTLEALQLAQKYLADPGLATEAGAALTQIASALRDKHRDEVLKALGPLLRGDKDSLVVGRAFKVLKDILKPANLALGATATNPDGLAADGAAGGPGAAIDGDPNTYWDEVDGADLYRLKVTFRKPTEVSSIDILWHPYEQHQAKNFDILCDRKVVKEVRKASCFENEMFVAIKPVRCTSVELVIPGKNGLVSPAIHEFRIYGQFP